MRLRLCIALLLLSAPAHAEVSVRKGQGVPAPTQPVVSNNLEAPVFQSDTRNLEAILNKEETARVTKQAAAAAPSAAAKTPEPVLTIPASEEQPAGGNFVTSSLSAARIFAIRWHEAFTILLATLIFIYMRKLYGLSREQHKILSHAIRSAEYSAAAAKRSAEICELLLKSQEKPDEAQGRLDI